MNNDIWTTEEANSQYNRIDFENGVKETQKLIRDIDNQKTEMLAKCFDAYDPNVSSYIRKNGLPTSIVCGSKSYLLIQQIGGWIGIEAMNSSLIDENKVILMWEQKPNIFYFADEVEKGTSQMYHLQMVQHHLHRPKKL